MKKISYSDLNSKQQEIYNFQKVASHLADYGFCCIKLADDWHGADFLAYHFDGDQTLKVQLKGRLTIDKKYVGKDLQMCFRAHDNWYMIEHDELVRLLGETTGYLESGSWTENGNYSAGKPSKSVMVALESYRISGE